MRRFRQTLGALHARARTALRTRRRRLAALAGLLAALTVTITAGVWSAADAPTVTTTSLTTALETLETTAATVDDDEVTPAPVREGRPVIAARIDDSTRTLVLVLDDPDGGLAPEAGEAFTLPDGDQVRASFPQGFGSTLAEAAVAAGVPFDAEPASPPSTAARLLLPVLPALLIVGALIYVLHASRTGALTGTKAKAPSDVERPSTTFADVAGCDEAAAELAEAVEYLSDPDLLAAAGATAPRGYLLTGPPGTGKTLLARAVAGEANVPFYSLSGSEFVEVYVGAGARKVRRTFEQAREHAPSIVFIDEIDAVGKTRAGSGPSSVGNEEREQTLNQLLVEMDGFEQAPIIVIAATNRQDTLDDALLRPGRLERHVTVPLPDLGGRRRIIELYADGKRLADDVDLDRLARRTAGMAGADLEALLNTAALSASRQSRPIDGEVLDDALAERRLGRARTSAMVTPRDRKITAWHEAGHAVAALCLPEATDPVTVTIVPRGHSGGATHMDVSEDTYLTREQARSQLAVALAGRAAEEHLLDGDHTQGAAGDLAWATDFATSLVTHYGMSPLGQVRLTDQLVGAGNLADRVTDEVAMLTDRALDDARALLADKRPLLAWVVDLLDDRETVTAAELRAVADELEVTLPGTAPWNSPARE